MTRRTMQALTAWAGFALVAWGVLTLVAPPGAGAQAPQRGDEVADPVRMGEQLWDRDCASCHGPEGDGTRWGPSLQGKGAAGVHLAVTTGRMPLVDLSGLEDPPPGEDDRQVPRGASGPVDYLPEQVDALVAHAGTILDGPDVPSVDVTTADLGRGSELYQRNCASCHSWSGRGGALTNGHRATSLEESTPTQVVEAMRTGLGTMPAFTDATYSDEDATDIAAYVDELRDPRHEGGHPLSFLGPAAEGLVAGAAGIGGLLLFVRWIGRRT